MCYTGQCPYEVYDGSCDRPPWKPCFLDEEIDKQICLNLKTQGFEIGYTCPQNFDEIGANINFEGEGNYTLPQNLDEDGV